MILEKVRENGEDDGTAEAREGELLIFVVILLLLIFMSPLFLPSLSPCCWSSDQSRVAQLGLADAATPAKRGGRGSRGQPGGAWDDVPMSPALAVALAMPGGGGGMSPRPQGGSAPPCCCSPP